MLYVEERDEMRPTAPDEERDRIPQGIYDVEVISAKDDIVKSGPNAGKEKLVITIRIREGEYAGRKLWAHISQQWALKSFILSVGCDLPENNAEINPYKYIGLRARVSVEWKNGWNNIKWLSDDDPQGILPEIMKEKARATKKVRRSPWAKRKMAENWVKENKAPVPEPADNDLDDEEVPF